MNNLLFIGNQTEIKRLIVNLQNATYTIQASPDGSIVNLPGGFSSASLYTQPNDAAIYSSLVSTYINYPLSQNAATQKGQILRPVANPPQWLSSVAITGTVGVFAPNGGPLLGSYNIWFDKVTFFNPYDSLQVNPKSIIYYQNNFVGNDPLTALHVVNLSTPQFQRAIVYHANEIEWYGFSSPNQSSTILTLNTIDFGSGIWTPIHTYPNFGLSFNMLSAIYVAGRILFILNFSGSVGLFSTLPGNSQTLIQIGSNFPNIPDPYQLICSPSALTYSDFYVYRTFDASQSLVGENNTVRFFYQNLTNATVTFTTTKAFPNFVSIQPGPVTTNIIIPQLTIANNSFVLTGQIGAGQTGSLALILQAEAVGIIPERQPQDTTAFQTNAPTLVVYPAAKRSQSWTILSICVHQDSIVSTVEGLKRIADIKEGDICEDSQGGHHQILEKIYSGKSKSFIEFNASSLGPQQPERNFYIMRGHPILIGGKEILPEHLINGDTIVEYFFDEPQKTYTLATERRAFILMSGIPVATWSKSSFDNFKLNDEFGQILSNLDCTSG